MSSAAGRHPTLAYVAPFGVHIGFLIWIGLDLLFNYRHHRLFQNPLTGQAASSFGPDQRQDPFFGVIRVLTTASLVPVQPLSFWTVSVLFVSEHGPFWPVGLLAGMVCNRWVVRTRNLADGILAHAATNAVLASYVLFRSNWEYWLVTKTAQVCI